MIWMNKTHDTCGMCQERRQESTNEAEEGKRQDEVANELSAIKRKEQLVGKEDAENWLGSRPS